MNAFRNIYSFDFMGRRYWWFGISAIVIGIGLISLFVKGGGNPVHGLEYGMEFREGTRISLAFEDAVPLGTVRDTVAAVGYTDAQIQQTANVADSGLDGFQIQTDVLSSAEQTKLKTALTRDHTLATVNGKELWSLESVSASFSKQVVKSSLKAVALALLLILIYVTIRFQWKFAVGAIACEIHDILMVFGVYSLTGREITTSTIAALLTILGYSLYDTVIVYDRIRENSAKFGRVPYADLVNLSIWETLTRSINTSVMTLLPVLCLLFFGGVTLQDFAFALTIGILSGAYSTIFIGSPVVTVLKEREPAYRKLREAARA